MPKNSLIVAAMLLVSVAIQVEAQFADLAITKTDNVTTAVPGEDLTYIIVATNLGPSTAMDVNVADTFPAGLTCGWTAVSTGGWTWASPSSAETSLLQDVGDLVPGSGVEYTITCAIPADATGTLVNTASIDSAFPDPQLSNNVATDGDTVLTPVADLVITKQDSLDPVSPGQQVTYTVEVTNFGPSDAADVVVTDTLPAGLNLVSTSGCAEDPNGAPTCTLGTVPASGANSNSFTITAEVVQGPEATVQNQATVTSSATLINTSDDTAVESTTIWLPSDVTGTKTVSGDFVLGGDVTYTIVLSNAGPGVLPDGPGDELVDILPATVELTGAAVIEGGGAVAEDAAANTVTWNGAIPADDSVTLEIYGTVTQRVGNFAVIHFDSNGDGIHDSHRLTDDPAEPGSEDATIFVLLGLAGVAVPAVGTLGLAILILGVVIGGVAVILRIGGTH